MNTRLRLTDFEKTNRLMGRGPAFLPGACNRHTLTDASVTIRPPLLTLAQRG
jgi:hypothetical protein